MDEIEQRRRDFKKRLEGKISEAMIRGRNSSGVAGSSMGDEARGGDANGSNAGGGAAE